MKDSTSATPAFDAWTRLVRAAESTRLTIERDLKNAGFPPLSWYDVLLELKRAGPGGLRPFELEQKLLLAQYNLSRLVDRIVDAGYAAKRPAPNDRRGHLLTVTKAGKKLLQGMWPVYRAGIEAHIGDRLSAAEATRLAHLLERLYRPSTETGE